MVLNLSRNPYQEKCSVAIRKSKGNLLHPPGNSVTTRDQLVSKQERTAFLKNLKPRNIQNHKMIVTLMKQSQAAAYAAV